MAIMMDGIFVNGQKVTFAPENILSGDASAYTEEIGTAVEEWLEENVTGGEQVTDTTLTLPGVPADAKVTGNKIGTLSEATRNLVDVTKISGTNITVSDGVVSGAASAFFAAFKGANGGLFPWLTFDENTQYTFSFLAKNDTGGVSSVGLAFYCKYSDDTTSSISISNSVTEYTKYTITSTAGKTLLYITASYSSNGAFVWHIKDLQVEKSAVATDYIPHISAKDHVARASVSALEAATEDSFNAVNRQLIFMNSRNLFTKTLSKTTSGITFASAGDGYITLNGSNASQVYFDISTLPDLAVESGKEYWLNYSCESSTISFVAIYFNYGSGLVLGYDNLVGINKIRIPSGITGMLLRLYAKPNITFSNTKYRLTISEEKSNTDLDKKYAEVRFIQAFGTGDSTIIKFSNGKVLVIDFGLDEPQGTLHRNWKRAIADLGFDHIDYAIISHYHGDHVGMLIDTDTSATDYVNVPSMIDSNTIFFLPNGHAFTEEELDALAWVDTMAGDHNVSNYNAVMSVLNDRGCKVVYPTENEKLDIGGCEVRFWNADQAWIMEKYIAHETYDYNEASLCCYITIGSNRMCFSGDIGLQTMDKFKTSVLACDIFKANHHATGYAIVPKFLNSLMPSLVVTLLGYNLSLGLGNSELQAWCEANNVPNVVTGIVDHNLSLHVDEGGYRWNTACRRLICADEGISS